MEKKLAKPPTQEARKKRRNLNKAEGVALKTKAEGNEPAPKTKQPNSQ